MTNQHTLVSHQPHQSTTVKPSALKITFVPISKLLITSTLGQARSHASCIMDAQTQHQTLVKQQKRSASIEQRIVTSSYFNQINARICHYTTKMTPYIQIIEAYVRIIMTIGMDVTDRINVNTSSSHQTKEKNVQIAQSN